MHSTHDVFCRKCGKNLAFWSGFGDNMQYYDEYECQGRVWRKNEHWHYGKTQTNRKPTNEDMIEEHGKVMKVTHHMKELWYCFLVNETYFCEDRAKKLNYICPKCKGEIKLTRKA
jgi:hypothetical protein